MPNWNYMLEKLYCLCSHWERFIDKTHPFNSSDCSKLIKNFSLILFLLKYYMINVPR